MTDIIVKIMVEVLNILAIATKETNQGRTSELAGRVLCIDSAHARSEKYLKKLVGRTDIEDALKRLDKLTQDEVRMATAQLLKLTHGVDDKVTGIDDKVEGVGAKVKNVGDKVKGVDNKLNIVGDTVKLVLEGARCVIFSY
jgi:archaellum component FlaC